MLREILSNEWFTILLVISIALVATTKLAFASRFNDFLTLVGNSKYLKIHSRDQKFIDAFDGLMFLNLIISSVLFIMLIMRKQSNDFELSLDLFAKLAIGLGTIFLIKILAERLIGSLFEIDELIDSYLFQKISYRNYLGLILIPFNILLLYTINPTKNIIYITVFILFIVNLIGILTTIKNHQKLIINNLFYFILYLCALEISPYIILYKIMIGVAEK